MKYAIALLLMPVLALAQDLETLAKAGAIVGRPHEQIIAPYVPGADIVPLCEPRQPYPLVAVLPGFERFDGPVSYSINLYRLPTSVDPAYNEILGGELSADVMELLLKARMGGNPDPNYGVEVFAFDLGQCELLDVFTGVGATLAVVPFYGSDDEGRALAHIYQTNRPGELVTVANWPTPSHKGKYFTIRKPRDRQALHDSLGIVDVPARLEPPSD